MASKKSGPQTIVLPFPAKGINGDLPLEQLADSGYAAPTTLNVIPHDWKHRGGGGVRPGLIRLGQSTPDQVIGATALAEFTPTISTDIAEAIPWLAVRDASRVGYAQPGGTPTSDGQQDYQFVLFDTGTANLRLDTDGVIIADGTTCYFPDGDKIYVMQGDGAGSITFAEMVAGAGSLPTGTFGCIYRDRLIISGDSTQPQNFFASRVSGKTDFDYSQLDSAAAFAGNVGVGDQVTALIPHSGDVMVIGCAGSIHRMVGDIGYGGQITLVSQAIGIMGPRSWTQDETGSLYFVGGGGFYRMDPAGFPQSLSAGVADQYFSYENDDSIADVVCCWDRLRKGCWIFSERFSVDATNPTHMFYHAPTGSFWPVQFSSSLQLFPMLHSRINRNGDINVGGRLLIGGGDGILTMDDLALDDDGTLIVSQLDLGPITPGGPAYESKMLTLRAIIGSAQDGIATNDQGVEVQVLAARDSQTVTAGTPTNSKNLGVLTPLFNVPQSVRVAGHSFVVRLSGDGVHPRQWSLDQIAVDFVPGGPAR